MPISPNQGSTGGGTLVTITGTNLSGASAVHFGDNAATSVTNVSPTQVTAVSPAGAAVAPVSVTTPGGTSNPVHFFYSGAPIITGVSSTKGSSAGGDTVTIYGANLSTATSVSFGGTTATPTVVSDSMLTVVVPAGVAGPAMVSVTAAGGSAAGPSYMYVDAPNITTVSPTSGPTTGGTAVTISGTELTGTTQVTFDGTPAPFLVVNSTSVSTSTPPGVAGDVDVVVSTPGGSATAADAFTYVAGPGI